MHYGAFIFTTSNVQNEPVLIRIIKQKWPSYLIFEVLCCLICKYGTKFQAQIYVNLLMILALQIGDRKDGDCLQLNGQVSRQPKRCRSAMLDPKGRAFCYVSSSL